MLFWSNFAEFSKIWSNFTKILAKFEKMQFFGTNFATFLNLQFWNIFWLKFLQNLELFVKTLFWPKFSKFPHNFEKIPKNMIFVSNFVIFFAKLLKNLKNARFWAKFSSIFEQFQWVFVFGKTPFLGQIFQILEQKIMLTIIIGFYNQIINGNILSIKCVSNTKCSILINSELTFRIRLAIDSESGKRGFF